LKALLDLSARDKQGLQPIQDIAARQAIPQRYLEQVLLQLKRAGFLESRRGALGGYRLNRPPDQVTVGAVLRAVEGAATGGDSPRRGRPMQGENARELSELWGEIDDAVSAVVDRVTLEDLRRRAEERRSSGRLMYHI
jgi:Rrf2 family protein